MCEWLKTEITDVKNKKEILEVSGHWALGSRLTNMCSGLYPRIGEHDI